MSESPAIARPPFAWRAAAALATLAALALVAIVVADWGWRWFGPAPVHVPRAGPANPAAELAQSGLFGTSSAPASAAAPAAETLRGDVRLLGVFAERDGGGHALFRLPDGSARLVAVGAKIDGDTTLVSVRPDGITVRGAAGERRIALRSTAASASSANVPAAVAAGSARNPECAPPAGYAGAVIRLNAELLQGLIAQPESWKSLVEPRDGALVVRDEGGFAAMLGLKRDDRIEQANGIALRSTDDVVGAVLRPLAASQSVRLAGTRQGQRRELLLQNAGRCPG
jgi:hypothetical protein